METKKQDMPPPGGFTRIIYERVPLKNYWPAPVKWLLTIGVMGIGWYGFFKDKRRVTYETIEKRAALFSILPVLIAENDRARLTLYRKLRDEEASLMKDVEGWKVGTYKGQPIYKTLKPNEWYEPNPMEMWVHSDKKEFFFPFYVQQLH